MCKTSLSLLITAFLRCVFFTMALCKKCWHCGKIKLSTYYVKNFYVEKKNYVENQLFFKLLIMSVT